MPNCLMQQLMLPLLSTLQFLYYIFMSFNKGTKQNVMLIDVFKLFIGVNVILIAWKNFFANMRFSSFSCYFWSLKTPQSSYYFFINSFWDEFIDLLMYYLGLVLEILFHEYVEHVCCLLFYVVDSWQIPSLFSKWLSLLCSLHITNACFFGNSDFIIDMKWVCSAALLCFESIKGHFQFFCSIAMNIEFFLFLIIFWHQISLYHS